MKLKDKLELNTSHIWGRYYELRINPTCIQRTVFLEEGGENSLHRHQTEEWMAIVHGQVEFSLGQDKNKIEKFILAPGETIFIPSLYWHRIRFVSGNFIVDDIGCAVINETMLGEHFDGLYLIERCDLAKPSVRHKMKNQ